MDIQKIYLEDNQKQPSEVFLKVLQILQKTAMLESLFNKVEAWGLLFY